MSSRNITPLFLIVYLVIAILTPALPNISPFETNYENLLQGSSSINWLGTDHLGRDIFSRLIWGTQSTLITATLIASFALFSSVTITSISLIIPRSLQRVFFAIVDSLLTLPPFLIALIALSIFGSGHLTIIISLIIAEIPRLVSIIHPSLRLFANQEYVVASKSIGSSYVYRIRKHILPQVAPLMLLHFTFVFSFSIFNASALHLLGFSGDSSYPELGRMLADGRIYFREHPNLAIQPGIVLTCLIMSVNYIADRINQN